jgi:hypothetical protein
MMNYSKLLKTAALLVQENMALFEVSIPPQALLKRAARKILRDDGTNADPRLVDALVHGLNYDWNHPSYDWNQS